MFNLRASRKYLSGIFLVLALLGGSFNVVLAEGAPDPVVTPGATPDPEVTEGASPDRPSVALENPIRVGSIQDLLEAILNIVMILMIPVIVFFIILSGFKYVTARGNASQTEEATQSLLYAIVGGVLILGAIAIAEIISNIVKAF